MDVYLAAGGGKKGPKEPDADDRKMGTKKGGKK